MANCSLFQLGSQGSTVIIKPRSHRSPSIGSSGGPCRDETLTSSPAQSEGEGRAVSNCLCSLGKERVAPCHSVCPRDYEPPEDRESGVGGGACPEQKGRFYRRRPVSGHISIPAPQTCLKGRRRAPAGLLSSLLPASLQCPPSPGTLDDHK